MNRISIFPHCPSVIKHGNGTHLKLIFLLKAPFIWYFPLPCLITRGYIGISHKIPLNHHKTTIKPPLQSLNHQITVYHHFSPHFSHRKILIFQRVRQIWRLSGVTSCWSLRPMGSLAVLQSCDCLIGGLI